MKKIIFLAMSALTLSSCVQPLTSPSNNSIANSIPTVSEGDNSSGEPSTPTSIASTPTTSNDPSSSTPSIDELTFENFYSPDSKIEIRMDFTNQSIYKLADYSDDPYKKDMYHPVDVTVTLNGKSYFFEECGARMKGNTSRNPNFVDSNGNIHAPVHFKISFNQTFDDAEDNDYYTHNWEDATLREARKDRRFCDAKKFDIKYNKSEDETYTKQAYAYDCFRSENIIAQHTNLVQVTINTENDTHTEVYEAQECIDKEFLKRRFNKDSRKGNLYKSTYTSMGPADLTSDSKSRIGIEAPNYEPSYDLKTNDDPEEIDHTLLTNLIDTLNNNTSDAETFKPILENMVNVEEIIKYQAMCWVIGNPDDNRNNYNNYYIYFNSSDNKAIFIPYDFDRCFGIKKDWAVEMENIPYYTTKTNNGSSRNWQKNPLMWRTIIETSDTSVDYSTKYPLHSSYKALFESYCREYAEKYLDFNRFKTFTDRFYYSNKNTSSGGANNITFASYADAKLATFN